MWYDQVRWQACAIVKAVLSRFVHTLHQGPFLALLTSFYSCLRLLRAVAALAASFDIHMHLDFILYDQRQPFLLVSHIMLFGFRVSARQFNTLPRFEMLFKLLIEKCGVLTHKLLNSQMNHLALEGRSSSCSSHMQHNCCIWKCFLWTT